MSIFTIDIGSDYIKYANLNEEGDLSLSGKIENQASLDIQVLMHRLEKLITDRQDCFNIDGIAISTVASVDSSTGIIKETSHMLPGYSGFPLKMYLEKRLKLPVTIVNDVHATALGEMWLSKIKKPCFIVLNLGLEIGGAVVKDGEIINEHSPLIEEVKHMTVVENGIECACGLQGCFELYGSEKALQGLIEKKLGGLDRKTFFESCKNGNLKCLTVLEQWVDYVAEGLKKLIHHYDPSLVVIGGGISGQGSYLSKQIEAATRQKVMSVYRNSVRVRMIRNKKYSNLFGAAYHFNQSKGLRS